MLEALNMCILFCNKNGSYVKRVEEERIELKY